MDVQDIRGAIPPPVEVVMEQARPTDDSLEHMARVICYGADLNVHLTSASLPFSKNH